MIQNFVSQIEEEDDLEVDNYKTLSKTMSKSNEISRDSLASRKSGTHSMNSSLSFRQKAPKAKKIPPKPVMTKYFSECLEVQ